jgi:hypothetical protein
MLARNGSETQNILSIPVKCWFIESKTTMETAVSKLHLNAM